MVGVQGVETECKNQGCVGASDKHESPFMRARGPVARALEKRPHQ